MLTVYVRECIISKMNRTRFENTLQISSNISSCHLMTKFDHSECTRRCLGISTHRPTFPILLACEIAFLPKKQDVGREEI